MFSILKCCWCVPFLRTLRRPSQCLNIADMNPIVLLCWAVPQLKTLLRHFSTYYNGELFQHLRHCWYIAFPITLLGCSQEKYCIFLPCHITLLSCSPSHNIAEAYFVLLQCWTIPNIETLLMYTLSCYIAELFQNMKPCRSIYTQSSYIAALFPIIKRCWRILCIINLLSHSQS